MLNYWRIYAQRLWKCLSTAMHQNSYRWSIPYLFVAFVGASGIWSIRIQQTWCLCWFIIAVHECHPQLASTPKCWLWYLRYPIPPGSHNYVGISLSLSRAILCGNICIYIYTYYVCKYVCEYIYIYTHYNVFISHVPRLFAAPTPKKNTPSNSWIWSCRLHRPSISLWKGEAFFTSMIYICHIIYIYIWVNYNISRTWILWSFGDDSPY